MIHLDCPFCDQPIPFEAGTDAFDCADCGIRLDLAPDVPSREALSLAA